MRDDIYAIPIETSRLRVYVIRISDEIVILGNGGIKSTPTYNEDDELNKTVKLLQQINRFINSRVRNHKIHFYEKNIYGKLDFFIKEQGQ